MVLKSDFHKMSGHSHGGGCSHEHEHDVTDEERGRQYSLYQKIDTERLQCLNESVEGAGRQVFKPWDQRLDTDKFVESDADEELLFNIPFTGNVKLKGVIVIGGEEDFHPDRMKLYKNRPNMTFDDTGCEADQEFEMVVDREGRAEYHTKIARFSQTEHLSIYFPTNMGAETTKIYYIGLKGDFTQAHKHGVTIVNYEARANPADHKAGNIDSVGHQVS